MGSSLSSGFFFFFLETVSQSISWNSCTVLLGSLLIAVGTRGAWAGGVLLCVRVRAAPWQATMALGQPRDRQAAHAKDRTTRQNSAGRNEPDRAPFAREDQGRAQVPHPHAQSEKKERKRDPRAQCARARKQRRVLTHCAHVIIHMPTCQETTLAHEECPLADQSTGGHAPLGPPSAAPLRQQLAPASRFLSSTKSIPVTSSCA